MILQRLDIRRLPGIESSFALEDLDGGLTIIVGRNATGKSSIVRALLRVLSAQEGRDENLDLRAVFRRDGDSIILQRLGRRRDVTGSHFVLPSRPFLDVYLIRHEDLLSDSGDSDEAIAGKIRQALAGGFDLARAREALPQVGRKKLSTARKRVDQARAAYRKERSQLAAIAGRQEELPALKTQRAEAQAAIGEVSQLEIAIEAIGFGENLARARAKLDSFPPRMDRVRGDDPQTQKKLRRRRETYREDRRQRTEELRRARESLAAAVADGVLDEVPDRAKALVPDLREASNRRDRAAAEWRKAKSAVEEALSALGTAVPDEAVRTTAQDFEALRRAVDECRAARRDLEAATVARSRWLELAAGAVALVLIIFAGWSLYWRPDRLGAAALVLGLLEAAVAFGLSPYGAGHLRKRLDTVEREVLGHLEAMGLGGVAIDTLPELVPWWRHWTDARIDLARAEAALDLAESTWQERLDDLRAILADAPGFEVQGDVAIPVVERRIDELVAAVSRRQDARRRMKAETQAIQRLDADLREVEAELGALFERVGVADGDEDELRRRWECLDEWKAARKEVDDLTLLRDDSLRRIPDEDVRRLAEAGSRAEIEARLEEARGVAQAAQSLTDEISHIEGEIRVAEGRSGLEAARRALEADRRHYEELRSDRLLGEAGAFLLAEIEHEHEETQAPRELRRARAFFAKFTHHEWRLELEGTRGKKAARFVARDNAHPDPPRSLAELSSATRMQLLLAARLAYIETLEAQFEPLPILVDEALANADPLRFRAVAEALIDLAAAGRQVIYLTAQPADVAAFRQVDEEVLVIDLDKIRRGAAAMPGAPPAAPEIPLPPAPDGASPEEYARRIGVPPIDLHRPVEAIHLFHLLRDDLPRLHGWLARGIETVGSLRSSLAHEGEVADKDRDDLCRRIEVAEAFLEAARIGRPPAVDRGVLEASGAVSDRFLDDLSRIAAAAGGDGARLLAALAPGSTERPKGFGEAKGAALRAFLAEGHYLDDRQPLAPAAIFVGALTGIGADPTDSDDFWRTFVGGLLAGTPGVGR